ncbi:MAG: PAS domain S-box protein, partial [archaeon]|nr:PAS domain S-box protein [archaeon]
MKEQIRKNITITIIIIGIFLSGIGMHQANMARNVSRVVFEAAHKHNWFWADGWIELLQQLSQQVIDNKLDSNLLPLTKSFHSSMEMTECFSSLRNSDIPVQKKIDNIVRIFKISKKRAKQIIWITGRYSSIFEELPMMMDCTDSGTKYSKEVIKIISSPNWFQKGDDLKLIHKSMKKKEKLYSDLSYKISEKAEGLYSLSFIFFCIFIGMFFINKIHQNHKNANKILYENQKFLQQAQSISQIGSWEWNFAGNSFIFSNEMCRIFKIDQIKQVSTIWDVLEKKAHPEDKKYFSSQVKKKWLMGKGEKITYRFIRNDGRLRWIDAMPPEIKKAKEDGTPLSIIGTIQDVTQYKQTEENLQKSENRYQLIAENIS